MAQDSEAGTSAAALAIPEIAPAAVEAPVAPPVEPAPAKPTAASRDIGTWTFRPWKGHDHWVHERTGRSTFNADEARKLRRL